MKSKHLRLVVVLAIAGLTVCIGAVATQKIVEGEREVSIGQVPEAVRATLLAQAQGNGINEIEMETENGRTVYEAEVIIGGQATDIKVAADGTLVGKEADDEEGDDEDEADDDDDEGEDEEQVALAQVPEAVRATIMKEASGAEIKKIEKENENGQTIYSAELIISGQEVDCKVAPDGTLLGKEMEDEDNDK